MKNDVKESSRREYIARINRVTDYIDSNLDSEINLSVLAERANFSAFHFHRIFTVLTGETPGAYLQRVRLEKSACMLVTFPDMKINEIAWQCGFGSISLFSRSFRAYFGTTAKDYRIKEKAIFAVGGLRYSKNGQLLSKNCQNITEEDFQLCTEQLKEIIIMETKVEIKEMPELKVVYIRHTGAFNLIYKAYDKLFKWAGPRGLLNFPQTKTITVYNDDPSITDIEKVRQDACITVEGDVKTDGEIGKAIVPGGKYAVGRFEITELEFEKAWNTMCLWMTESGYQPSGKCYELYYNDHTQHPERKFILDICIPVKEL
jgi:AraC family transcriptional regulator